MNANELYEALRQRALDLSKTITLYLDPKMDVLPVDRAKELTHIICLMDQVGRERSRS